MENVRLEHTKNMASEDQNGERRKEPRYLVEAKVIVRKKSGEVFPATAIDISSSGMRLRRYQSCPLDLEDEVSAEIEVPEFPDKPLSSWGYGRVAYKKNERGIGIQLFGGRFGPLPDGDSEKER
jgi:hypothetical protein